MFSSGTYQGVGMTEGRNPACLSGGWLENPEQGNIKLQPTPKLLGAAGGCPCLCAPDVDVRLPWARQYGGQPVAMWNPEVGTLCHADRGLPGHLGAQSAQQSHELEEKSLQHSLSA